MDYEEIYSKGVQNYAILQRRGEILIGIYKILITNNLISKKMWIYGLNIAHGILEKIVSARGKISGFFCTDFLYICKLK